MSNICRFTSPASRDIEAIIDLIADNSGFDAAERFLKKVNQKCKNLAIFPNMGVGVMNFLRSCEVFQLMITYFFIAQLKGELRF